MGQYYEGSWKNNVREGLGVWHDPEKGQKYAGQWSTGTKHGWGVYETKHIRYEGYWKHDQISGKGECIYLSHHAGAMSQSYVPPPLFCKQQRDCKRCLVW
jgi:hypothetical protein